MHQYPYKYMYFATDQDALVVVITYLNLEEQIVPPNIMLRYSEVVGINKRYNIFSCSIVWNNEPYNSQVLIGRK
jgi:hypothetical protein